MYVLHKVDSKRDQKIEAIVRNHYQAWKSGPGPSIFVDFIEKERNSILKEYHIQYAEGAVVIASVVEGLSEAFDVGASGLYRPLSEGPYAGEDARDVLKVALEWTGTELTTIEAEWKAADV